MISVALTLAIASSIAFLYPHFFGGLNISFKDMVEVIIVRYEDGTNMTVSPSTPEGDKLISACEDILLNLYGKLKTFFRPSR